MLTAINNVMIINKKASRIYIYILFIGYLFPLKFVGTQITSFIISWKAFTQSSIIPATYLSF